MYVRSSSILHCDKSLYTCFTWQRTDSFHRLWMYSTVPQWFDLRDVSSALLLHTASHPYRGSSTPQQQQQVWLSSQTIRAVHITTHDRHKLFRVHWLATYNNIAGALPGHQSSYWETDPRLEQCWAEFEIFVIFHWMSVFLLCSSCPTLHYTSIFFTDSFTDGLRI